MTKTNLTEYQVRHRGPIRDFVTTWGGKFSGGTGRSENEI